MPGDFDGVVAAVTGGGSGIGLAAARLLATRGASGGKRAHQNGSRRRRTSHSAAAKPRTVHSAVATPRGSQLVAA